RQDWDNPNGTGLSAVDLGQITSPADAAAGDTFGRRGGALDANVMWKASLIHVHWTQFTSDVRIDSSIRLCVMEIRPHLHQSIGHHAPAHGDHGSAHTAAGRGRDRIAMMSPEQR